jgi:hypothetical protein
MVILHSLSLLILLSPFAMWPAFPTSDYYEDPVPPPRRQSTTDLPASGLADRRVGGAEMVPTFTMNRSAGSVPDCAPAASPRVRRRPSPWPPQRRSKTGFGVAHTWACTAARPVSTRLEPVILT